MGGTVDVAAELDTFTGNFAKICKRKDLISAGVGQKVAFPSRETVKPACLLDYVGPGAEIQMIGISEDYLESYFFKPFFGNCFYCRVRSDGHERRSLHVSMRKVNDAGSCTACGIPMYLGKY